MFKGTNFLKFLFILIIIIFIYKSYYYSCYENFLNDNIRIQQDSNFNVEIILEGIDLEDVSIDPIINNIQYLNENKYKKKVKFSGNENEKLEIPNLDNSTIKAEFIFVPFDLNNQIILKMTYNSIDIIKLEIIDNKLSLKTLNDTLKLDLNSEVINKLNYVCIIVKEDKLFFHFNKIQRSSDFNSQYNIKNIVFGDNEPYLRGYISAISIKKDFVDFDLNDKYYIKDQNNKISHVLANISNYKKMSVLNPNISDSKKNIKMFEFNENSFIHIPKSEYFNNDNFFSLQYYFYYDPKSDTRIKTLLSTKYIDIYIDQSNNILFYLDNILQTSDVYNPSYTMTNLKIKKLYHLTLNILDTKIYLQINNKYLSYDISSTYDHEYIYIATKFKEYSLINPSRTMQSGSKIKTTDIPNTTTTIPIKNNSISNTISNNFEGYIGNIQLTNGVSMFNYNDNCSISELCKEKGINVEATKEDYPELTDTQISALQTKLLKMTDIEEMNYSENQLTKLNVTLPNKVDFIVKSSDKDIELLWLPPNNINFVDKYIIVMKIKKSGVIVEQTNKIIKKPTDITEIEYTDNFKNDFFYPYMLEELFIAENNRKPNSDVIPLNIPINNYKINKNGKNPDIRITSIIKEENTYGDVEIKISNGIDFLKGDIIELIPYNKNANPILINIIKNPKDQADYGLPIIITPGNENCSLCSYKLTDLNNNYKYKFAIISVNEENMKQQITNLRDTDFVEISFDKDSLLKEYENNVVCQDDGTFNLYKDHKGKFKDKKCIGNLNSNLILNHNDLQNYLDANSSMRLDSDINIL